MKFVTASILGTENKKELVDKLISQGIEMIHYDSMDSKFVEALSLPVSEIKDIVKNTNKHIVDIHLMTTNPEQDINEINGIADFITFHIESTGIDLAKKIINDNSNQNIGIAISPNTEVDEIKGLLDIVSHVLLMSVIPGKGGQTFIKGSLDKIKELDELRKANGLNILIQVDGGINYEYANACFEVGADSVVSGSFLINNIEDKDFLIKMKK